MPTTTPRGNAYNPGCLLKTGFLISLALLNTFLVLLAGFGGMLLYAGFLAMFDKNKPKPIHLSDFRYATPVLMIGSGFGSIAIGYVAMLCTGLRASLDTPTRLQTAQKVLRGWSVFFFGNTAGISLASLRFFSRNRKTFFDYKVMLYFALAAITAIPVLLVCFLYHQNYRSPPVPVVPAHALPGAVSRESMESIQPPSHSPPSPRV